MHTEGYSTEQIAFAAEDSVAHPEGSQLGVTPQVIQAG